MSKAESLFNQGVQEMGRQIAKSKTTVTVVELGTWTETLAPSGQRRATTSTVWARPCQTSSNTMQEDQTYLWETLGK